MENTRDYIRDYIRTGDKKWFIMIYEETMPRNLPLLLFQDHEQGAFREPYQ
jgi:hypothetical protein